MYFTEVDEGYINSCLDHGANIYSFWEADGQDLDFFEMLKVAFL